jgi:ribosome-associated protein
MTAPVTGDLVVPPGRGLPDGLVVPAEELLERFSRSSGPGGQSVNTTDSRVSLTWNIASSTALTEYQTAVLLRQLATRLVDGSITINASEQRSQLQNRQAARGRLVLLLREAFVPTTPRRATRPSRAAKQRRIDDKKRRGDVKSGRGRIRPD